MAESFSHSKAVKDKMSQLANVTSQAESRITAQILSVAAKELSETAGTDIYDDYISSWSSYSEIGYGTFDSKRYDELTDEEKVMRNLIYAEAYFGLYFLAIALKKLVKGNTNTVRESVSGASVQASPFDDLIANAELYKELAINCVSSAIGSDDSDVYSDGSLGVFVV
jgi:hypothetical protein